MARRRKLAARRDAREGTLGEWLGSVDVMSSRGSARKLALERPGKTCRDRPSALPIAPAAPSVDGGWPGHHRQRARTSALWRDAIGIPSPGNRFAVSAGVRVPGSDSTIAAYAPRARATRGDATVWIRARQRGSITAPSAVRIGTWACRRHYRCCFHARLSRKYVKSRCTSNRRMNSADLPLLVGGIPRDRRSASDPTSVVPRLIDAPVCAPVCATLLR
jgi:hypothetical protein